MLCMSPPPYGTIGAGHAKIIVLSATSNFCLPTSYSSSIICLPQASSVQLIIFCLFCPLSYPAEQLATRTLVKLSNGSQVDVTDYVANKEVHDGIAFVDLQDKLLYVNHALVDDGADFNQVIFMVWNYAKSKSIARASSMIVCVSNFAWELLTCS